MTVEAIKVFQVPVKHEVIKFATSDEKLVHAVNRWAQEMFKNLSGPGVQLESIREITLADKTLRVVGDERTNGETWFWMPASAIVCDYEVVGEKEYPRDVPLFSVRDCVENVLAWSSARGILDNGKWTTQVTKFYEEDGEAATGISKTKRGLIMDGIGDALVVMVNVIALVGGNPMSIPATLEQLKYRVVHAPFGDSHRLFHKMRLYTTLMHDDLYNGADLFGQHDSQWRLEARQSDIFENFEKNMKNALWYMTALANAYDMPLEHCFSLAWDEIKDRKGYLNADGIFIKESDA